MLVSSKSQTCPTNVLPAVQMHIGDVACVTGLTQRTIRYYEELGLLPAPERTQGDFRLFTVRDVRRLSEITRLKELLGLTLAEIKEIVSAEDAREQLKCDLVLAEDMATQLEALRRLEWLTSGQLAVLDRKLAQMTELRSELVARLSEYRACIDATSPAGNGRTP